MTVTTSRLPPWTPAHKTPKRPIPHAIVQCKDGTIAPAKWSGINHCWLAWNGEIYVDADVIRYIDLGDSPLHPLLSFFGRAVSGVCHWKPDTEVIE